MKTIYYKKVPTGGRPKYEAVSEYDSDYLDSFPIGSTVMVQTYKGGQSRKYSVDPALAPMVAASMVLQQSLTDIIVKANEYKPAKTPLTVEQRAAWEALSKSFNVDSMVLHGPSMHDIADNILKAISAEAEKLLTNAAVKASYEEFLMIAALSKNHDLPTEK